jgi:hypothetical protein
MATMRIYVLFDSNMPANNISIMIIAVVELNAVNAPMK